MLKKFGYAIGVTALISSTGVNAVAGAYELSTGPREVLSSKDNPGDKHNGSSLGVPFSSEKFSNAFHYGVVSKEEAQRCREAQDNPHGNVHLPAVPWPYCSREEISQQDYDKALFFSPIQTIDKLFHAAFSS